MDQSDIDLLHAFIASEDAGFAEERQGDLYPMRHYDLSALAPRAGRGLAPDMLQRFHFHWLRVGDWSVASLPEKDLPSLIAAYRQLTCVPVSYDRRQRQLGLEQLFCFGFDEAGALPSAMVATASDLKQRARLIGQCNKYQSFHAQREKAEKFLPYRPQAQTVLEALRHLGHDPLRSNNVLYWGMALIALLNEGTRIPMLQDLLEVEWPMITDREHMLSVLHHTAGAARPHCTEDTEYNLLCERLAVLHDARVMAGDAVKLVQRQQWHVENIRDWSASITLYQDGEYDYKQGHPRVSLNLSSWPDSPWSINLSFGNDSYVAYRDQPTRDDFGLPPLTGANLEQFPQWIRQINTQLGINLVAGGDSGVSAYKNRKLAKQLDAWIRAQH
ncbi:hypothetical protein [Stenotrophomonas sp. JAG2]|uniref:hypothetical protein n=1 Tax=Stenotrophomonas sp. JAG2 TaxID=3229243 RepID=UPI0034E262E2